MDLMRSICVTLQDFLLLGPRALGELSIINPETEKEDRTRTVK